MIRHYKGKLGEFDYNDEDFEICCYNFWDEEQTKEEHIFFKKSSNKIILDLPKGCIDTSYMFFGFNNFPSNFTLGGNFDTRCVKRMDFMFYEAELPEGFSLGYNFDTSNVESMENIFNFTRFPESFILCEKFNIENVLCIDDSMFEFSDLPQWVTADRYDNAEVIEELKYKNPRITECTKLLVNLFKENKTVLEAKEKILKEHPEITRNIIDYVSKVSKVVYNKLSIDCLEIVPSLFSIKGNEQQSRYTVGDVCNELLKRGFPEEIVMKSIVNYLEDQVLV